MHIYQLCLTLQDPLYFATRELGRLYATENYLHNYALTYALGLAKSCYHDAEHIPHYQEDLEPLNKRGIYVTPARPVNFAYVTHTYKWADLRYQVKMEQSSVNLPTFGRIRELAPESTFEAYLLASEPVKLPQWIRLGKWMSKVQVKMKELPKHKQSEGIFTVEFPLNPLDTMFTNQLLSYDVVNMPPVSLIRNVQMRGRYYQFDELKGLKIPVSMEYRFQA
ncbi:CRISPR-associated protein Csc1 [Crinalium epipsammum PCC 9333]|uniref:CRISPR-associated protein Csc1 n=2 Tax=Crinalium TaxID=241421 RepID=K9VWD3_9CYAN|nr:CRISPR-associated protein Csc1 [Crinalium epipsammum PCC 9333]